MVVSHLPVVDGLNKVLQRKGLTDRPTRSCTVPTTPSKEPSECYRSPALNFLVAGFENRAIFERHVYLSTRRDK
jgi:hypothetical protein